MAITICCLFHRGTSSSAVRQLTRHTSLARAQLSLRSPTILLEAASLNWPREASIQRLACLLRGKVLDQSDEDVSTNTGEDVPPTMELKQERERHSDPTLEPCEAMSPVSAAVEIGIPERITETEGTSTPPDHLPDLLLHERVGDVFIDNRSCLDPDNNDHNAEYQAMKDYLIHNTMPNRESDQKTGERGAVKNSLLEGHVVGVDSVQDGGGRKEHREVIGPLGVVEVGGVEDGAAETDEHDAHIGEGAGDGIAGWTVGGGVFVDAVGGVGDWEGVSIGDQKL